MSYQALYRQWRPQSFAELVGQENITRTLQNALEQGRVAHAYLFCGPRGTGKTSAAKILAKAVNCENGPGREPCNECSSCRGIQAGRVMDVLEIDAASNRGIDEMRELREKVRYTATEVRNKVYIIDEVHMLTPEAFNALLKTLEEPPRQVFFILATTEPHKLPATIVSRCQRLDFRLIGLLEIMDRLRKVAEANGTPVTEGAIQLIAEAAAGGLRDALSLLEQVQAFAEGEVGEDDVLAVMGAVGRSVFYDLTGAFLRGDLSAVLTLINDVVLSGKDLHHFTLQAISYYRDLMVALACAGDAETLGIAPERAEQLREQAGELGMDTIGHILSVLHELLGEIRWATRPRLLWELAVFRIFGVGTVRANPVRAAAEVISELLPVPAQDKIIQKDMVAGNAEDADPAARVFRLWPRILEQIKKENIKTHAMLLDGQPGTCDGKVLDLVFANSFHVERMAETGNKKCLEKVLKDLCGEALSVRCILDSQTLQPEQDNTEDDQEALISSAADIFRGQIIEDAGTG